MARTLLFDALQRAARIARWSRHAAAPLDEVIARVQEMRVDAARRRFLRDACAMAATLALTGCAGGLPKLLDHRDKDEVIVVGAGIAGLAAAWRLRQAGVRVRVIEASHRVGGRMMSLRGFFPDAQVVELGGELIDSGHVRLRALANELGIALDDLKGNDALADADVWIAGGRRYSEAELIRAFVPVAAAIERDLATLGEGDITYTTPQNAQALDALSLVQWFDRNDVTGWLRSLLDVAYTTEMGLACDRQSALNMITFIGTKPDRFRVFGDSDERCHVRGGNDRIPQGLAAKLGDAIETDTVLEALRREANGTYVLSVRQGGLARVARVDGGARDSIHHLARSAARRAAVSGQAARDPRTALRHECEAHDRFRATHLARTTSERQHVFRPAVPDDVGSDAPAGRHGRHPRELHRRATRRRNRTRHNEDAGRQGHR